MYFVADAAEFWTPVETQLLCELVSAITWQALRIMSALITALSFLSSWSHSAKFIAGLYNFFLKYLWFLSTRNMVRYAYETADCDKMRFLDPCLTLLLFICLWTLCVPSPFPHILKEQTSVEGVTVLIAKVKPVFSSLFPPESLFPFKTKSILFIFVGVRKLVDIQAHASLEWWKVRANLFFFFWFYLDFCKEGTKPFTLKETLAVWWDGCSKWWNEICLTFVCEKFNW